MAHTQSPGRAPLERKGRLEMKQKPPFARPINTTKDTAGRRRKMDGWSKQVTVVLGVATMTFATSLAVLWPRETQAEDEQAAVADDEDVGENTTKIGTLRATSRLVRDERLASTWYLELKVENKDLLNAHTADVEGVVVAMDTRSEMSRVPSMPKTVFKCNEPIMVAAGETAVRRCVLPAALAKKVASTHAKAATVSNRAVVRGETRYRTTVVEVVNKKQPSARQASRS
jgi:hypothetical protein